MKSGEYVLVGKPTENDMYKDSFTGVVVGVSQENVIVCDEKGYYFIVSKDNVKPTGVFDYVTVGIEN